MLKLCPLNVLNPRHLALMIGVWLTGISTTQTIKNSNEQDEALV